MLPFRRSILCLAMLAALQSGCAVVSVAGTAVGVGTTAAGLAVDAVTTGVKVGAAAGGVLINVVTP